MKKKKKEDKYQELVKALDILDKKLAKLTRIVKDIERSYKPYVSHEPPAERDWFDSAKPPEDR